MYHDAPEANPAPQDVTQNSDPEENNATEPEKSPSQGNSKPSTSPSAATKAASPANPDVHHLLQLSEDELTELGSEALARLSELTNASLKASQVRDRQAIFREMAERLRATDIDRVLNQGTESERKEALRNVRALLVDIGFKISIEALEKHIRSRFKRQK